MKKSLSATAKQFIDDEAKCVDDSTFSDEIGVSTLLYKYFKQMLKVDTIVLLMYCS